MKIPPKQYKKQVNEFFQVEYPSLIVVNKYWNAFRWFLSILCIILLVVSFLGGLVFARQLTEDNCEINLFTIKHEISPETLEVITKYVPLWRNIIEQEVEEYEE